MSERKDVKGDPRREKSLLERKAELCINHRKDVQAPCYEGEECVPNCEYFEHPDGSRYNNPNAIGGYGPAVQNLDASPKLAEQHPECQTTIVDFAA